MRGWGEFSNLFPPPPLNPGIHLSQPSLFCLAFEFHECQVRITLPLLLQNRPFSNSKGRSAAKMEIDIIKQSPLREIEYQRAPPMRERERSQGPPFLVSLPGQPHKTSPAAYKAAAPLPTRAARPRVAIGA